MKSQKIADGAGFETRVVILDSGEESFATLMNFANETGITSASLTAMGAFEKATIGWFDFDKKTYKKIEVEQQCEVLRATETLRSAMTARPVFTSTSSWDWPMARRGAGIAWRARSGRLSR